MMTINPNLYIIIKELKEGPPPFPSKSNFTEGGLYRVLGGFSMSESSEMYFLLANNGQEPWWISNRHTRIKEVAD